MARWPPARDFNTLSFMKRVPVRPLILAALATLPLCVSAQSADVPRTVSGKPDLNGLWQALGNAHWDIGPHAARAALAMQPGPLIPVPANEVLALGAVGSVPSGYGVVEGGVIPYLPEALELRDENREHWLERDPEIRCYLPGVPRATYMPFPFRIFQSETRVFMAYEYAGAMREIYLEDPGPPQVDAWMGQSVGRWEWTIRMPLYRNIDPDARLGQFKCVEFVEELMYGHLRKNPIR